MTQKDRIRKSLKRYVEINQLITSLENEKKKLKKYLENVIENEYIINLNDEEQIKAFKTKFSKESIDINLLKTNYTDIYEKVKKTVNYEFLKVRKIKIKK